MQVFKAFFQIIKVNKVNILVAFFITFMMSLLVVNTTSPSSDEDVKANIIVVDKSHSVQSEALVSYLDKKCSLQNVEEEKIEEALYHRIVEYVLYIPSNFANQILSADKISLEKKQVKDSSSAYLVDTYVNMYVDSLRDYYKYSNNKNDQEVIAQINANLDNTMETEQLSLKKQNVNAYFNFLAYTLLSCIIVAVGIATLVFNQLDLRRRNAVSPMSPLSYTLQIIFAYIILTAFTVVLSIGFAYLVFPEGMAAIGTSLYTLNVVAMSIASLTLAYLVASLCKNMNMLGGIANIISLGTAFLCGCFVPQEMLGEGVLNFSKLLPGYYFVNNNDLIYSLTSLSNKNTQTIFIQIGIILLFALFFLILAVGFNRKKNKNII